MMKAQTQAITLVLIAGIVISLVGFAYSWGKPMIDKRSTVTDFTAALKFMEGLDSKIVDMAGTCSYSGSCEEVLELPRPGIIRLDEENNSIVYEFEVYEPLITQGEVLFNTVDDGDVARYGETPGVIKLTGESLGPGVYKLRFTLRYRELDSNDPFRGYKIELSGTGIEGGSSKITFYYDGSETRSGAAYNKGNLIVSKIKVQPL